MQCGENFKCNYCVGINGRQCLFKGEISKLQEHDLENAWLAMKIMCSK